MKKYILFLSILLLFGENIINNIGVPSLFVDLIYLLSAICLLIINYKKSIFSEYGYLQILIIFLSLYSLYNVFIVRGEGSRQISLLLCSPPLLLACFPRDTIRTKILWDSLFKVLIMFFIVECSIAILERIFQINFFPWSQNEKGVVIAETFDNVKVFRSCALLGHSLQNALTVSTIMSFILVSKLKDTYKYSLWLLGYIAILCFNTRTSIVGNILILLVYSFVQVFGMGKKKTTFSFTSLLRIIPVIALIAVFVLSFDLGGRLFEMGLVDDSSAQVRINTWSIFNYFDLSDFLFGLSPDKVRLILIKSGIRTTENFWIDFLLRLGLIVLLIIVIIYVKLVSQIYRGYKMIPRFFTAVTFVLLASTNNSLSATWLPLFVYLFSIYAFKHYDSTFAYKKSHKKFVNNILIRKF